MPFLSEVTREKVTQVALPFRGVRYTIG